MIPSMMTLFVSEMQWQINIIYVGRMNNENMLSAIGLCNQLFLSIPLAVTYGTTSVLETLVSQAYGSKQLKICGNYLNKQILITTIVYIPIGLLMYNCNYFLVNFLG